MRNKEWLMLASGFILIPALFILLLSATSNPAPTVQKAIPTCCKKSKQCNKGNQNGPEGIIIENLSRQFISINALN